MTTVVHGTKRRAPVTRETHTLHGNVGVVQLQPGGGASTQVKLREQKSREFQTVLEFMQSK